MYPQIQNTENLEHTNEKIGLTLRYLTRYKRFHEGHKVCRTTLERLAELSNQPFTPLTHNQVTTQLQQTRETLKEIKKNHKKHRENSLQQLYQEYTDKGNTKAQTIINSLIEQEETKNA